MKKRDPTGAMALSYLRRCEMSRYQGPEYRPQPASAGTTRRGFGRVPITVQAFGEAMAASTGPFPGIATF